ncbi:armadillo repeat-containing protein 2 [Scaptodrosophila lebanonensis]|uniref:Armadillo repeat-containing protein 2 n=1 Tax=Drosophila lebanonensis TaxID=7225 RepID=A0A6J2TUP1_DROLE|nr:armadillo repeat-containing protein 2 [Scaptodrosophila lebanonensis]
MSLLLKRRSRSETRTQPPMSTNSMESPTTTITGTKTAALKGERPRRGRAREPAQPLQLEEDDQQLGLQRGSEQHLHKLGALHQRQGELSHSLGMGRRRTSAELINEAKLFLGDVGTLSNASMGGARLVNTRRPITPREPGRVLYGKVAMAGRPPSAFSMRYLQNESNKPLTPRQLPALHGNVQQQQLPPPTRNGALLSQSTTETLIELLKQHAGLKECSEETVKHINAILQELYNRVRKQERNFKRGFILGGLYGLVECTAPRVLLAVARVVLALRVTGSNLTGACKLIFKVARHEQNDSLFHENDLLELLIDGLGHASPLDEPEACIYAYGSIRFLTASTAQERDDALNRNWSGGAGGGLDEPLPPRNTHPELAGPLLDSIVHQAARHHKLSRQQTLVERLAHNGALELMILHLQMLNEAGATRRLTGPPLHTLYQLSAALRALAGVEQKRAEDVVGPTASRHMQLELACPHLIRAAEISMGELEVQANVVRTLSVLSEDVDCCETLLNYAARIGMLLGPCADTATKAGNSSSQTNERALAVLSRLGYILGNILAKYESARVQYYHNDVAMEYLLNVLDTLTKTPPMENETLLDVQIKLIRVVANMSVNSEVGFGLGNTRCLGAVLLKLLNDTVTALDSTKPAKKQELLHATLGALHNLCFYQDKHNAPPAQVLETVGSLQSIIPELANTLCTALCQCQLEASKVELARVLGNLTRNEQARRCFCAAGGLPLIMQQLTRNSAGQDYELKTCAIGVLVNLLGDSEQRAPFLQLRGADVLELLLRGALEQEDWFLATIVCQAMWNLLIDAQCAAVLCRNGNTLDEVCDLLADYLDEERGMGTGSDLDALSTSSRNLELGMEEVDETPDALWEDFAIVATDLLERIQNNFDKQTELDERQSATAADNGEEVEENDEEDVFIEEM